MPRLFIGSLSTEVKEDELKEMFSKYGNIVEFYVNSQKNFAFIRIDSRDGAQRALAELDGKTVHGRQIRVKRAPHHARVWVGKLPYNVSNEILADAFSMFGEVERAVVACDERGKSKGWGYVEFKRKNSVLAAIARASEGNLLLTASPQPVKVEAWAFTDDEVGVDSRLAAFTAPDHMRVPPRFARQGELEHKLAEKWKQLYAEEAKLKADLQKQITEKKAVLEQEEQKAIAEERMKRQREHDEAMRAHEHAMREHAMREAAMREHAMREAAMREHAEREERLKRPHPYPEYGPPPGVGPIFEPPRCAVAWSIHLLNVKL